MRDARLTTVAWALGSRSRAGQSKRTAAVSSWKANQARVHCFVSCCREPGGLPAASKSDSVVRKSSVGHVPPVHDDPVSMKEILAALFKLGATSYGGPAIMGIMQAELQEKQKWVSR